MNIVIFVGPSVPLAEAQAILPNATWMPPVAQGDVATILRHKPDVIGIIDGFFERIPAVWHKEILMALKQGIRVFGAASMGALRAAELAPFGMEGIGEIFTWYRDEIIDGDDEVAIRHMPAEFGYKPMSEAMVNIRKTLATAVSQNILTPSLHDQLIDFAKQTHYAERTYNELWQQAQETGIPESNLRAVKTFVAEQAIDLKQQDGIALLNTLTKMTALTQAPPPFEFNLSATFARLLDRDVWKAHGDLQLTSQTIINHARLEQANYHAFVQQAGIHDLLLYLARLLDIRLSAEDKKVGWKQFRKAYNLPDDESYKAWRVMNQLTADEAEELVEEWILIQRVQDVQSIGRNQALLRQLKLEGVYAGLVEKTAVKETLFQETDATEQAQNMSRADLLAFWWQRQGKEGEPPAVRTFARKYHFPSEEILWRELLKYYLYHNKQR